MPEEKKSKIIVGSYTIIDIFNGENLFERYRRKLIYRLYMLYARKILGV